MSRRSLGGGGDDGSGDKAIGFGMASVLFGQVLGWSGSTPLSEYWNADDGYVTSSQLTVDRASRATVDRITRPGTDSVRPLDISIVTLQSPTEVTGRFG